MNIYVNKDKKKGHRLKGLAIFGAIVGVGLGGLYYYHQVLPGVVPLSAESQSSLIQVETEAVKNNAKPVQVSGTLLAEWDRLSDSNQALAGDLIYTSVQNSTIYYNNAVLLMAGELEYNTTNKNSLSAVKNSAWVAGFIQDIENNSMKSYNLNSGRILVLPDFDELQKKIGDEVTSELRDFLTLSAKTQDLKVFTDDQVDVKRAAEAYQILIDGLGDYVEKYGQDSKYLADLSSLARIYHDVAFGFVQTNNLTLQADGSYKLSDEQVKAITAISKGDGALKTEATKYLENVSDNQTVTAEYLKNGANLSMQLYGSSVYWQSDSDLSSLISSDGSVNLEQEDGNSGQEATE